MLALISIIAMGILSIETFLLNILVVYLIIKMKKFTRDVIYILGLAVSDSFPFIITLAFILYCLITYQSLHQSSHQIKLATQIFEYIEMSWPFLSVQFASSLAVHRLSFIYQKKINELWIAIPFASSITINISLIIVVA